MSDASVTMSWFLSEESSAEAVRLRDRLTSERAMVPSLWLYEVANALTIAARRGRLSTELVADCAAIVASLPIDVVLDLASRHGLSACAAAYLQLAMSDVPLATFDDRLAAAARTAGVLVIGA